MRGTVSVSMGGWRGTGGCHDPLPKGARRFESPGLHTPVPNVLDTATTRRVICVETVGSLIVVEPYLPPFGVPATDDSSTVTVPGHCSPLVVRTSGFLVPSPSSPSRKPHDPLEPVHARRAGRLIHRRVGEGYHVDPRAFMHDGDLPSSVSQGNQGGDRAP